MTDFRTRIIHEGSKPENQQGAICTPIYQSAVFEMPDEGPPRYIRLSNTPNHEILSERLRSLDGAAEALVTSSGMAAISSSLISVLKPGDHLLAQECLYGGTYHFITEQLERFGVETSFVRLDRPEEWISEYRPTTRAFMFEPMTNPLLQVGALKELVEFCREKSVTSIIDNTILSPVNFRPLEWGVDIVIHSATKYLNGHSDVVAGVVCTDSARMERIRENIIYFGGNLDPNSCFLLERGLKTLSARVEIQNQTGMEMAQFLAARPEVERVNFPGLEQSAEFARASEYFSGLGSLMSFELKGDVAQADRLIEGLKLFQKAPSFGGVESVIIRPVKGSHSMISPEERARIGISDRLIRVSFGLESVDDLKEDFDQSLKRLS